MQTTTNLGLKKPENTDPVEIQDFNDNADIIDAEMAKKIEKTGDGSNVITKFSVAATLTNLVSGERLSSSMGKIMKAITDLIAHIANKSNPHGVTKSQVGLGSADNTSDANKPVSSAQQAALDKKVTSAGGDIADTKVSTFTASTASYPVPAAGETPKVAFGKIKKFFEDIRNATTGACFIGQIVNNCVTNNAKLPLSAAQGKALMDLYTVLNTKLTKLDSNFADAPFIDFHILGNSHVYVAKYKGITSLGLSIDTNDVPTMNAYSSVILYTLPEEYCPVINVNYHLLVVDAINQCGTFLWINQNGDLGLETRYNALAPNTGAMYGSVVYKSK